MKCPYCGKETERPKCCHCKAYIPKPDEPEVPVKAEEPEVPVEPAETVETAEAKPKPRRKRGRKEGRE